MIITNNLNDWNKNIDDNYVTVYQHKCCPNIFKNIKKDTGEERIYDLHRYICIDKNEQFQDTAGRELIDNMFPISLPYNTSSGIYEVYEEKTKLSNDLAINHIKYIKTTLNNIININKYYLEKRTIPFEISYEDYMIYLNLHKK